MRAHIQSAALYRTTPVSIPFDHIELAGDLYLPPRAKGIVVFAHGSGSSRFSPRNRFVAEILRDESIGSLLIDLLTPEEGLIDERTRALRFNIPLLAQRLEKIGGWVLEQVDLRDVKLGYFGASTGGAAALIAAAARPDKVAAVISRGGRPDLAAEFLPAVRAPVLLIVGERDPQVMELNREALKSLNDRSRLQIIPRATHLFEEPGALEAVAQLAAEWFEEHFA